jgi:hypothetical protein
MKDVLLVVLGAVLGVGVKAFVDPYLDARKRKSIRGEGWLEDAIKHTERVLLHVQTVRSKHTAALQFDGDRIARAILRSLTPEFGPEPLQPAAGLPHPRELAEDVKAATESWMAVRLATMDDQHGHSNDEEQYEPMYALQRYETALLNFAFDARKQLSA